MVDMYTHVLTTPKKEEVITSFSNTIRVVIATTAFGMGIDLLFILFLLLWSQDVIFRHKLQRGESISATRTCEGLTELNTCAEYSTEQLHSLVAWVM